MTLTGKIRTVYMMLVEKPEGKHHLQDVDVEGENNKEWILKAYDGMA
jgi:hypothetical protein